VQKNVMAVGASGNKNKRGSSDIKATNHSGLSKRHQNAIEKRPKSLFEELIFIDVITVQ
jgi:hypothetical protein